VSATVEKGVLSEGPVPVPRTKRRLPRRLPIPVVVALVVVVVAELAARAAAPRLPVPQVWPSPEAQHKSDQLSGGIQVPGRADVVIFGASMADAGIDPVALATGIGPRASVYNASLVGTPIDSLALWATYGVVPRARPRVVVLGLSPVELNPGVPGGDGLYKSYLSSDPVKRAMGDEGVMAALERRVSSISTLFRLRKVLRTPASWSSARRNGAPGLLGVNDPPLTSLGFNVLSVDSPYDTYKGQPIPEATRAGQYQQDLFKDFRIGAYQVAVLRGLIVRLEAQGARVVVVDMPLTSDAVGYLPGHMASVQATDQALRDVSAATGASYLTTGIWSNAMFADPGHLNGSGAAQLSRLLTPAVQAALAR
jgi:hypothetical protein